MNMTQISISYSYGHIVQLVLTLFTLIFRPPPLTSHNLSKLVHSSITLLFHHASSFHPHTLAHHLHTCTCIHQHAHASCQAFTCKHVALVRCLLRSCPHPLSWVLLLHIVDELLPPCLLHMSLLPDPQGITVSFICSFIS